MESEGTMGIPRAIQLSVSLTAFALLSLAAPVHAAIVQFFDPSQTATPVSSTVQTDTISSEGYLFTYTRDKLFTGGLGGGPIGRAERVSWPDGVEAQAITEPPPGAKPNITLTRIDGDVFDLTAFTAKLLANTSGAGGSIEIMPLLNGEDGLPNPATFQVSGNAGQSFSFDEFTPSFLGNTALLKGFDTYKIGLYVDFALTSLTLEGAPVPEPALALAAAPMLLMRRRRRNAGKKSITAG
jgi:hypothetical protein